MAYFESPSRPDEVGSSSSEEEVELAFFHMEKVPKLIKAVRVEIESSEGESKSKNPERDLKVCIKNKTFPVHPLMKEWKNPEIQTFLSCGTGRNISMGSAIWQR